MTMTMKTMIAVLCLALLGVGAVEGRAQGHHNQASISVVLASDQDLSGTITYNDFVTFSIEADAWNQVQLACTQNGQVVLGASRTISYWYPIKLASQSYTGGPASCTATLQQFVYKPNGVQVVDLASTTFAIVN